MNKKPLLLIATVASLMLSAHPAAHAQVAPAYGQSAAPAPLVGSWVVTIRPIFCTTTPAGNAGDDVPGVLGRPLYVTFGRDGILTEANSSPSFEPGQRSAGHGYWERTGSTSYQFAYEAFIMYDSTLAPFRYKRGHQRVDQTLELQTADEFTSTGTVKFFAENSATSIPPSGCARTTGVRLR